MAKQNLGFRVQRGCGVALPGLLQTAFRPLWPPSAPTDRCAFLAPGEKTRADLSRSLLLPAEKELGRISGECGGPETTRVFQAGESGQQCPRRRSSTEKKEEFWKSKEIRGTLS